MKFHRALLLLIVGILLGLLGAGILDLLSTKPRGQPVTLNALPTQSPLRIFVSGAVHVPGVYSLPPGSIIQDAISAAGGTLPTASLKSINLAAPIHDGQQIHLASQNENPSSQESHLSSASTPSAMLNINTVDAQELESLPGIGPSLAEEIIKYRQQYGPFMSIDELLKVPGIGPAKLEQIQDLIVVR